MRKINVTSLKSGEKLGKTIYSSSGEILLKEGTPLTEAYIRKLKKVGVSFVFIEDNGSSNLSSRDVVSKDTRAAAVRQVKDILLKTRESGKLVIEPESIYSTVSEFTDQLFYSKTLAYNLNELRNQDDYTFAHSVNVCVLSLMTGITMGYSEDQLKELGVGAILHDIGKMKVPPEILNKPGKLNAEEFNIMKKHSGYGYDIIVSGGSMGDLPAIIAHQHHENLDGSGYPLGISGDDFSEFAQIVSIADKFDALTANRVYRPPLPAHEAYEMCAGAGNYWFSEKVVKAFVHNISAYPEGTAVELSNGVIGVALDTPKGSSLFPRVRVVFDHMMRLIKQQYEIALYEKKDIKVVRVLKEEEYNGVMREINIPKQ